MAKKSDETIPTVVSESDRMQFELLAERGDRIEAQLKLLLTQAQQLKSAQIENNSKLKTAREGMAQRYKIGDNDRVDFETGAIMRG